MVIHGYRQAMATAQTAPLLIFATVSGCHALAKTVDPQPAVNMGLISSFGRHARSLSLCKFSFFSPRWRSKASLPTLCFAHAGAYEFRFCPQTDERQLYLNPPRPSNRCQAKFQTLRSQVLNRQGSRFSISIDKSRTVFHWRAEQFRQTHRRLLYRPEPGSHHRLRSLKHRVVL